MPTTSTAPEPTSPGELDHPGFGWLDDMACAELDDLALERQAQERAKAESEGLPVPDAGPTGALGLYFVDAGHVIGEDTLNVCRKCPVRRECIIHAYKGGPGGTAIVGGYMGGFSLGQRKAMSLEQALERAENDPPRMTRKRSSN